MVGLIVSIMEVGAFFGSICTAFIGENIGRKKSIAIGVVTLIVGSVLQATAYHRAHLIVGRIVSGIGLGMVNSTVPVMQAEFAPKASRGLCMCYRLPNTAILNTDMEQLSVCNYPPLILEFS
jgi:MFS family permease